MFIEELGFDYNQITKKIRWDKQRIKDEFIKFAETSDINPKNVNKIRCDLYAQIREKFGSYESFVVSMGYDYKDVCKTRAWTKEEVIESLNNRHSKGLSLKALDLRVEELSLYKASRQIFGSYENALTKAGFNYLDTVGSRSKSCLYGHQFEKLLGNMFTQLGLNYEKHSRKIDGIIPDFFDEENNEIIDAKLSSWTVFYSDTVEKYTPHCDKLTIVYLRGSEIKDKNINFELRPIDSYYPRLIKAGLFNVVKEFEDFKNMVDSVEEAS
jgi:hypothetical protein